MLHLLTDVIQLQKKVSHENTYNGTEKKISEIDSSASYFSSTQHTSAEDLEAYPCRCESFNFNFAIMNP